MPILAFDRAHTNGHRSIYLTRSKSVGDRHLCSGASKQGYDRIFIPLGIFLDTLSLSLALALMVLACLANAARSPAKEFFSSIHQRQIIPYNPTESLRYGC